MKSVREISQFSGIIALCLNRVSRMNAIADQPATSTEIVNKTTEKKKVSALVRVLELLSQ